MKRTSWFSALLLFVLLGMAPTVFAAPAKKGSAPEKKSLVHWMDYTQALEKAKSGPKLIFVDLYADWCVPCRIMDANVYSDPTVAAILNTRFYAVKLDADSQDSIMCDGQKNTVQRCYFDVWASCIRACRPQGHEHSYRNRFHVAARATIHAVPVP